VDIHRCRRAHSGRDVKSEHTKKGTCALGLDHILDLSKKTVMWDASTFKAYGRGWPEGGREGFNIRRDKLPTEPVTLEQGKDFPEGPSFYLTLSLLDFQIPREERKKGGRARTKLPSEERENNSIYWRLDSKTYEEIGGFRNVMGHR